uniref:Uncharacterized protein n=1 Tax=Arundo donax TaxID=35708 RepID=A0A0A9F1N9_ARUDO
MSLRPSLKRGRRMVMLFTDLKVLFLDLALSRSASATLLSRSFSTRRRFIGSTHMEAALPIDLCKDQPD